MYIYICVYICECEAYLKHILNFKLACVRVYINLKMDIAVL